MGPEVRFKSARRCQGIKRHQGNRCIDTATGKQQSFWVFQTVFQFLGISNWAPLIRFGSSQTLIKHTDMSSHSHRYVSVHVNIYHGYQFRRFQAAILYLHQPAHHHHHHRALLAFSDRRVLQIAPQHHARGQRIVSSSKNSLVSEPPSQPPSQPPSPPPSPSPATPSLSRC